MVRIATVNDAEQLNILNNEFNGEGDTSIDNIRNSLMNNKQEGNWCKGCLWNDKVIVSFVEDLKQFKQTIEEYNSQDAQGLDTADTYKLITITSDGQEVVKSFGRSEYSERAKLLYNDILNSIDEMGQAITDQEKRQILFEILEKLC